LSNHPNHGNAPPSPVAMASGTKKVHILAMGSSRADFDAIRLVEQRPEVLLGAEIWGINYMGAITRLDRIIHVDPVHAFLGHAPVKDMCDWALRDGIPLYTSDPHPAYINHVLYPFDRVVQALGLHYLNNSVAYALALAIVEGYTEIGLWGADFSYPNAHMSESGRACVEFWMGVATQRGIKMAVAQNSTLLDLYCKQQPYGFWANPLLPPAHGGRLLTVPEIVAHCQQKRESTRIVRPQIHAYAIQPSAPEVMQPFAPMAPEHTGPVIIPSFAAPAGQILADGSGQPVTQPPSGAAPHAPSNLHVRD